jgi:hypothetical protein
VSFCVIVRNLEYRIMATKTACPVSREVFRAKAPRTLAITINGKPVAAEYKEFNTGSMGWFLNGKTTVDVDGVPCSVQIGLNLTLVGSKELPPLQQ